MSEENGSKTIDNLSNTGRAVFAVSFIGWIVLFLVGTSVSSQPFRDALAGGDAPMPAGGWWGALLAALFSYTLTNIPLLCCLASLLGALARRVEIGMERSTQQPIDDVNPYISACLRGLFVYLFVISGLLIVVESPFTVLSAAQYVRLAGFVSLTSFLLSHNPGLASQILLRAANSLENRQGTRD